MTVIGEPVRTTPVAVRAGRVSMTGALTSPTNPAGVVVLANASIPEVIGARGASGGPGSFASGHRETTVALVRAGFATLRLDLLAGEDVSTERRARAAPHDVSMLADRMAAGLAWLAEHPDLGGLPVGLFGAGIGSAAAVVTATRAPAVRAIVARCGRPDLAYDVLRRLLCPTLWIVGGADVELLDLHHRALRRIGANARLHVVPGAGRHLDTPGAIDDALRLAAGWFREHLARPMQRLGSWTGFTTDAKQGSSSPAR